MKTSKLNATTKITKTDDEFRVRLFIDGEYQAGADYFTDDREDAKGTAAAMIETAGFSDKTTDFAVDEQADFDSTDSSTTEGETMRRETMTPEKAIADLRGAGYDVQYYRQGTCYHVRKGTQLKLVHYRDELPSIAESLLTNKEETTMNKMTEFATLTDLKTELSKHTVNHGEYGCAVVLSRGRYLYAFDANGDRIDGFAGTEEYDWNGKLSGISDAIERLRADFPQAVELTVECGYNGGNSPHDFEDMNYEPWIAEWSVTVWKAEEKPTHTVEHINTGCHYDENGQLITIVIREGKEDAWFNDHSRMITGTVNGIGLTATDVVQAYVQDRWEQGPCPVWVPEDIQSAYKWTYPADVTIFTDWSNEYRNLLNRIW